MPEITKIIDIIQRGNFVKSVFNEILLIIVASLHQTFSLTIGQNTNFKLNNFKWPNKCLKLSNMKNIPVQIKTLFNGEIPRHNS